MGRHRWTDRLTVEQCPISLPVSAFHRAGLLTLPLKTVRSISLSWTYPNGERLGRLECTVSHSEEAGVTIYIRRQLVRISIPVDEQTFATATVRPHLGGQRYWFLCGCGRKAGSLYLPPGQRVFRCRSCCNLTYRTAQTHNQRKQRLARNIGAVMAMLHSKSTRRQVKGIGIFAQWFGRSVKRTSSAIPRRQELL